jgi:cytochrome c biogenesis protein CcmG, thiol:disulfide interchange protein DsbE
MRGLLAVCAGLLVTACAFERGVPEPGSAAPAYAADRLDGERLSLADLRGQTVLLNVWATWCHPCRREMPAFEALHRDLGGNGLSIVAVSIDGAGATPEIRAFLREYDITFTVLHDPEQRIQRRFALHGVPETFLIGPDGTIHRRWIGRIDPRSPAIRNQVLDVMAGQPAAQVPRTRPRVLLPGSDPLLVTRFTPS